MDKPRSAVPGLALGVGAVVLMVACCIALPALLAGGALGVVGGLLGNPVVIGAGVVVAAGGVAALLARAARRGRPGRGGEDTN